MSEQLTLQPFFSAMLHIESHLASLEQLEDTLLGIGDFLSEHDHPTSEAIEDIRRSLRIVRCNLWFLLAIQIREVAQNLQTYVADHGRLPVLDVYFRDE